MSAVFLLSWASCRARFLADVCGHCRLKKAAMPCCSPYVITTATLGVSPCLMTLLACCHRLLLYGTPSDSTLALTLQEAADEIMSELFKQSNGQSTERCTEQAQPSLKALMTALMWGAASLTARQLQVAARELLRLIGTSSDDEAVDQLSQQIR